MSENIALKAILSFSISLSDVFLAIRYIGRVYLDRLRGTSREIMFLEYLYSHAQEENPDDIIEKADTFSRDHRFTMNVGFDKGAIILSKLNELQPKVSIELGTYLGYSAIYMARPLRSVPGAHIYSFEISPLNAAIATKIIEFAGYADMITVIVGTFDQKIESVKKKYGFQKVDFVFIDHAKERYLPDFQLMEQYGLFHSGTLIAADNLGFPGNPPYKSYVFEEHPEKYSSELHTCKLSYTDSIMDAVGLTTVL